MRPLSVGRLGGRGMLRPGLFVIPGHRLLHSQSGAGALASSERADEFARSNVDASGSTGRWFVN